MTTWQPVDKFMYDNEVDRQVARMWNASGLDIHVAHLKNS